MKKIVAFVLITALLMASVCFADSSWYCRGCGRGGLNGNFCHFCGTRGPYDITYCSNCGLPLSDGCGYDRCPKCRVRYTDNSQTSFIEPEKDYDPWTCQSCWALNDGGDNCCACGIQRDICPGCGVKYQAITDYNYCEYCGCQLDSTPQVTESDSWICRGCGNACTAGKFCSVCGTKKPDNGWTCSNCGNMMDKGTFCSECGTRKPDVNATLADTVGSGVDISSSDISDIAIFDTYPQTVGAGTLSMPSGKSIYDSPEYSANIVYKANGDDLNYISYSDGWYCVLLSDGSYGYANEKGCRVLTYAESDSAREKAPKDEYGTLRVEAGTNIRGSASTNAPIVMTTINTKNFKYITCENGWYKIILDDGTYGYVYNSRATVIERAPGDNWANGISSGLASQGSSSGGNSGGGSGNTGGNSGGRTNYDTSCSDPDISNHKLIYRGQKTVYYALDPEWHNIIIYNCYSCTCGKNTLEEFDTDGAEFCTWVNGRCSKCGGHPFFGEP